MTWTDERVEKLRSLWTDGLTASQIAKALGSVSRNAVIGKVHRLGLSHRAHGQKSVEADTEELQELSTKATAEQHAAANEAEQIVVDLASAQRASVEPVEEPVEDIVAAPAAPEPNPVLALAAEAERNSKRLSLLDLNERTCKWPIGDPSTTDFFFCGAACAQDKPYCSAHVALAYQPMSSRRERERERDRNRGRALIA